ncbi:geranylgeranylglyceryl/heptaprenylglyceryl phosphate synthase [Candidatus Poribacteria bacterium]|nr:geranylgeranylglyceryl/heptaprenylglyceryl phosphate synthase [Candidatus Poribacteria bacterium]
MSKILNYLNQIKNQKGAGYLVLIDPDKQNVKSAKDFAESASKAGLDAFLVGSSILMSDKLEPVIKGIKQISKLPVIISPGGASHISRYADAILFLSLISGRNPEFLIGEHVKAAPIIKRYGLEAISTGYILVDGGICTSVQFMSATIPIPRDKTDIAVAHAMAAELLGMKTIYLECGSGACFSAPEEMISAVKAAIKIPLIVGGGITKPEDAASKVKAGADFIVTGNALEKSGNPSLVYEFAQAIHNP